MNNTTLMGGQCEMSIGDILIPAEMLGDITPNYAEGMREANTQAGVRRQSSGIPETAELVFTLFLPNIAYLRNIFNIAETDPIILGGATCSAKDAVEVNIHPVCNGNDAKDDIHITAGKVVMSFNPTLSTTDNLQIEITIQAEPSTNGRFLLGYPDPSTPQYWDVTTQTYLPVATEPAE